MVSLAGRPGRRGVLGQVKDGRLIGVIGWDSPRGMLRWTSELERELNRPRTAPAPAVPVAEPIAARAAATSRPAFAPVGPPPREVVWADGGSAYRAPESPETDAIQTPRGRITQSGYHSGPIPRITDSGPGNGSGSREPVRSGRPLDSGFREPVGRSVDSGFREPVTDSETDAIQTPRGRITQSGYHSGPIPRITDSDRPNPGPNRANADPRPLPRRPDRTPHPAPERAGSTDRPPLPPRRRGEQIGLPLPPLEVSYPGTRIPRFALPPIPDFSERPSAPLLRVTDPGFTEPAPAPGFVLAEDVPGPEPEPQRPPEPLTGPLERYTESGFATGPIPRITQDMLDQARNEPLPTTLVRRGHGHPSEPLPRVPDNDAIDTPRGRITRSGYHSGPIPRVDESGYPVSIRRLSNARRGGRD
jgi:hypothetical protein